MSSGYWVGDKVPVYRIQITESGSGFTVNMDPKLGFTKCESNPDPDPDPLEASRLHSLLLNKLIWRKVDWPGPYEGGRGEIRGTAQSRPRGEGIDLSGEKKNY
jgi:hypothetical protein